MVDAKGKKAPSLPHDIAHLIGVTLACAITEVVCYHDAAQIYAAIMTGNTVQLGWALAVGNLAVAMPALIAIGSFLLGCVVASALRHHLKPVRRVYGAMAVLLAAASVVRLDPALRMSVELPLLAFALALQGEGVSEFAGVKLQTVVVTNNLVKFSRVFTERFINPDADPLKRPAGVEVLVPGICWLTFFIGAGVGGVLTAYMPAPLLVPVGLLVLLALTAS